jgi:plastocyanin
VNQPKELRMNRTTLALLSALAAVTAMAVLPTGALGGAHAASSHSVALKGVHFQPGTLNIRRGDSVTWAWNTRNSEHNVAFHGLHSRTGSRGSFSVKFSRAGTFSYVCTIHVAEGMRGKIVVH